MSNKRIYYSHEAELQAKRDRILAVVLFLSLGLGIGAVLALLFAPGSGKEVREGLLGSLEESLDGSREVVNRLEKELRELRSRVDERLG